MNSLILTSQPAPRTYTGFLTCDNLQIALPIRVLAPIGRNLRTEFLMPSKYCSFGKKIKVLPNGHVWIGKYVLNTNGTKIFLTSIGVNYDRRKYRPKDQNYFDLEDLKLIRAHFDGIGLPVPEEIYLNQLDIFEEMLDEVAKTLRKEGYEIQWRPIRGKNIARIEISKDYQAPVPNGELVELLKTIVSSSSGEPYNSGTIDSQGHSRQRAYAYWSLKMPGPFLSSGRIEIKLYEKDSVKRLEVSAENVPFQKVECAADPMQELIQQLRGMTEEMAEFLREVDLKLLACDERINSLDLTELKSVLKYYGLDVTKESCQILLRRLGGSAHAYTPANHRGKCIGRKTFANLCDPIDGICDLVSPAYNWEARTLTLRLEDWRERANLRRLNYELKRSKRSKTENQFNAQQEPDNLQPN